VLADTAVVGHLGARQLAALGLAGAVLSGLFGVFNFLSYAVTAQVARYDGAGRRGDADEVAGQALWLSLAIGVALLAIAAAAAVPIVSVMGGSGQTARFAVTYLRIAAIGLPFVLVTLAGQGYLRGVSNLRLPLVIVVAGNIANLILELVFVYGFHWGIAGSAAGTAIAQAGMGSAFAWQLFRAGAGSLAVRRDRMLRLLRTGGHIFVRTTALLVAFVFGSAVVARAGTASLGAHQVAFQLWLFLALILDAIAIAGQVIVGRTLGAGKAEESFDAASRMVVLSVLAGAILGALFLATGSLLPQIFTSNARVLARIAAVWPIFASMQPLNGAVFALDGILIGAGDSSYIMWSMVASAAVFAPIAVASLVLHWGLVGIWLAILALIGARLVLMARRFRQRRWLVVGA
jgi:putative MATE family efflux protein